ncbi:hypothetical protein BV25DRAFT_1827332 [Artomyces pyxidatus]|uniref:Uncharacterized protein n=1 Tax=Artomyces pyxidatus TaxID=48021 RepID=A0ACB8SY10_9AGAM|nr:hypothetical protein BV25DRAFT_1827332 [Artomyces pyxidatus]
MANAAADVDESMNLDQDEPPAPPPPQLHHPFPNAPAHVPAIHISSAPAPAPPALQHPSAFMLSAPVPVAATPPLSEAPRRPRFTMGPRADCEKCRLGVKGHSVHFD